MARARTIKPGFFKNEELAELGFPAMLLFAGLWTLADREGRLEDRPKRIKAEIFPYHNVKIDDLLSALNEHHFITRYEVNGDHFITVPTWKRHQFPNKKEPASTIPILSRNGADTVPAQCFHESDTASIPLNPYTPIPTNLSTQGAREDAPPDKTPPNGFELDRWAAERIAVHPNKRYPHQAIGLLAHKPWIFDPEARHQFEEDHAAWCETELWTWKQGTKCPTFSDFVNDYEISYRGQRPPAEAEQKRRKSDRELWIEEEN